MKWISLHTHSQYSILDSTASIAGLVKKAHAYGMPALALTDFCNLYGAIDFYKECKKKGIKPIIGSELMFTSDHRSEKKRSNSPVAYPMTLLCKNEEGYRNLCRLSSISFTEGFYFTPRIDRELLERYHEGLICLTGPIGGFIPTLAIETNEERLDEEIRWFQKLFKEDLFFEIQRLNMTPAQLKEDGIEKEGWRLQLYQDSMAKQEKIIRALKGKSEQFGIRLVATNDIHYIEREEFKAHEILMNVQSGEPCEIVEKDSYGNIRGRTLNPKRRVYYSHEHYFKGEEQMSRLFSDLPDAVSITCEIADRCSLSIDFDSKCYPVFVPPSLEGKEYTQEERDEKAKQFLVDLCHAGIKKRYTKEHKKTLQKIYPDKEVDQLIQERLDYELSVILPKGMCDYLLIVYDFIHWAKKNGIPMGPGRGSGVGSIILYLIEVTDIEPLRFKLFFERFINPERLSYPDIDVDICQDRRQEVIEYTIQKYGKDRVAQIITFGTMKAKMAVKDVGRVLNIPLPKVNEIAKLIPDDLMITIEKALEVDPDLKGLYESDDEVKRLLNLAKQVEGSIRNTGLHAAGLIISAMPLMDRVPVCTAKDADMLVTQYSMKPVEAVGMLKIDFLGLKTLTTIQKTVDFIESDLQEKIDWINLPLDNKPTFDLLCQGKTSGIFQLESGGMQELAKQLHIDKFEEIIAVGALYRPGPMEMIPSFIQRKHGKERIEFDHEWMKEILIETYGIMVYQEQVMQIASVLAGYSLGEGDVLRRAMGKKDAAEMAKQREKFKKGAEEKGIDETLSMMIFDKVEKFASYGFNKSHAAAYGFLSYVTAYLKGNYPNYWMSALMTCDMTDISKVAKHIAECQTMQIELLPPDINESRGYFTPTKGRIRFGLSGIKGIGDGVVETIMEERGKEGPFDSLQNFIQRIDNKKIGKKTIEILIEAGCFDSLSPSRRDLLSKSGFLFDQSLRLQKEKSKGYMSFFEEEEKEEELHNEETYEPESPLERLKKERELLGVYLSGHPLKEYKEKIESLGAIALSSALSQEKAMVIKTAFVIEEIVYKISARTQKKFAILIISDQEGRYEIPIWSDLVESKGDFLIEHQLLIAIIEIEQAEEELKLIARDIFSLEQTSFEILEDQYIKICDASKKYERRKKSMKSEEVKEKPVSIYCNVEKMRLSDVLKIKQIFDSYPGKSPVRLFLGETELAINALMGIQHNEELKKALELLPFVEKLQVI